LKLKVLQLQQQLPLSLRQQKLVNKNNKRFLFSKTYLFTLGTNRTRRLSQRSIEEGGAPVGVVYLDIHKIAESKGLVSSVSFYADQSCAFANIEIGAFDLVNRQLDTNSAEFILAHKSETIKLGDASYFKGYMSLITIQLCDENSKDISGESLCKGSKFQVLPQQYIGIRSNTCRFGYAATPQDLVFAVTLVGNQIIFSD